MTLEWRRSFDFFRGVLAASCFAAAALAMKPIAEHGNFQVEPLCWTVAACASVYAGVMFCSPMDATPTATEER